MKLVFLQGHEINKVRFSLQPKEPVKINYDFLRYLLGDAFSRPQASLTSLILLHNYNEKL